VIVIQPDKLEKSTESSEHGEKKLIKPRIPIWLQLSIASIFLILVTIISLSFVIIKQQKEQLYQQAVKIGMVSLNYFNSNARRPLLEDDILRLNILIKEAGSVEEILYAVIADEKKRIRAHTDQSKIGAELGQFSNMENIFKKEEVTCFNYFSPTGEQILNLSRPITFRTKYLGEIHIGVSIDFIEKLIHEKSIFILIVTSI